MLSKRVCIECIKQHFTVFSAKCETVGTDLVIVEWSCPYILAQDCRLKTQLTKDSEPPERCPMKLEHLMEAQGAKA